MEKLSRLLPTSLLLGLTCMCVYMWVWCVVWLCVCMIYVNDVCVWICGCSMWCDYVFMCDMYVWYVYVFMGCVVWVVWPCDINVCESVYGVSVLCCMLCVSCGCMFVVWVCVCFKCVCIVWVNVCVWSEWVCEWMWVPVYMCVWESACMVCVCVVCLYHGHTCSGEGYRLPCL